MGSNEELGPAGSLEDYFSIADASSFLGKCSKTVRSYVRNGILRARRFKGQGRTLWIKRDDLKALKEMGDRQLRTTDLWDLLKSIRLKLRSIEHKQDFLMHVNGLDVSVLRDAEIEVLLSTYDEVCEFLDLNPYDVPWDQMEEWAGVFLQFSEIEFERLAVPVMDNQPWRPFQRLCRHLMNSLRRKKGFATHPDMQHTYRLLDKARKQIAQSALIYEENRAAALGGDDARKIVALGYEQDSLDRYIAAESLKARIR